MNVNKCKIRTCSRKYKPVICDYYFDNVVLDRNHPIKDLGITFNTKLSFNDHMLNIYVKKKFYVIGGWNSNLKTYRKNRLDKHF